MIVSIEEISILLFTIVNKLKKTNIHPLEYSSIISEYLNLECKLGEYSNFVNKLDIKIPAAFRNVYFPNQIAHENDTKIVNLLMNNTADFKAINHLLTNWA